MAQAAGAHPRLRCSGDFNRSVAQKRENMPNTVFFDLETQRSFDEVGGRNNIRRMSMSVGVTLSSATGEFRDYLESDVQALIDELTSADLVVGFNVLNFDYEVLRGYTTQPLDRIPTVDLLQDIYQRLGFRVSLDSVAGATLGVSKLADGLQAIRWYREGKIAELLAYCRQDVDVTRQVYVHGRENGLVKYTDKFGRTQPIRVKW